MVRSYLISCFVDLNSALDTDLIENKIDVIEYPAILEVCDYLKYLIQKVSLFQSTKDCVETFKHNSFDSLVNNFIHDSYL